MFVYNWFGSHLHLVLLCDLAPYLVTALSLTDISLRGIFEVVFLAHLQYRVDTELCIYVCC